MWSAFRYKDFRLLWFSQAISSLGDRTFTTALNWLVASNFGTFGTMAMVQLTTSIPIALTRPLSGAFIDKYSPRNVLIWLNIILAIIMCLFVSYTYLENGTLLMGILVFLAIFGIFEATLEPAFFTAIPSATKRNELESANALVMFLLAMVGIIGPFFSSLIIQFYKTSIAFGFNAISFLIAAILIYFVSRNLELDKSSKKTLPKVKEAWSWLKNNKWAIRLYITEALANLTIGLFTVSLPILLYNSVKVNVTGFGSVYSVMFLGVMLATIVSGYFLKRVKDKGRLAYVSIVVMVSTMGILVFQKEYLFVVLLSVVLGFSMPWFDMIAQQTLQEAAPEQLLGRLISIAGFVSISARVLAYIVLLIWKAPLFLISGIATITSVMLVIFVASRNKEPSNLNVKL
jgi:DHA3 family macrolide efflux protein-like MFS transporter